MKRDPQLDLDLRRHGGKRPGAGRKPKGERAGVSHLRRPSLRKLPVHVTLRVRREVWSLRSRRCFRPIRAAFVAGNARFGFSLSQFSVQGNHVHLIVEAEDRRALSRGVQGLAIRIAKGLNRVMRRRGTVFADRYHAHVLRTPSELRRALSYVLENLRKHEAQRGNRLLPNQIDEYSSRFVDAGPPATAPPRFFLLARALHRLRPAPTT
jgi:REP element-mobilizing transposase RayT